MVKKNSIFNTVIVHYQSSLSSSINHRQSLPLIADLLSASLTLKTLQVLMLLSLPTSPLCCPLPLPATVHCPTCYRYQHQLLLAFTALPLMVGYCIFAHFIVLR